MSSQDEDYENLLVEADGPVARIMVNRPEAMNALNESVLQELEKAVDGFSHDSKIRVMILEGAGGQAFIAGADIAAMKELTPAQARKFAHLGHRVTRALENAPQVTVAKVQGFALGGGCELAMACDLVIAGRKAKFGQPEVNLGIIPGFGGTQRLVARVGPAIALDMLLTGRGRTLDGDEAAQVGLASRVVDDERLDAEVQKVVDAVSKTAPAAVRETKRLARSAGDVPLKAGLDNEAHAFGSCFAENDAREGITAFLEKRTPSFAES